ncbi:MAG: hypothetical protein M0042_11385 [Nitrospiraceae bacterium]|nr:hypothetical protein [Nitrospiraceae bacterium]
MKKGTAKKARNQAAREVELNQVEDVQEKLWQLNGLFTALDAMGSYEDIDPDAIQAVTVIGKQRVEEIKKALKA